MADLGSQLMLAKILVAVSSIAALAVGTSLLAPEQLGSALIALETRLSGLHWAGAQAGDHQVRYLHGGDEDGEPVLLLHGFSADAGNWVRFIRHLGPGFRIIAPDLPGFGSSERRNDADYHVAAQADRMAALLRQLKIESAHVAGNSMGGHIAALLAARHPAAVRSLGLIDNAGIEAPLESEFIQGLRQGRNALLAGTAEEYSAMLDFVFVRRPWLPYPVRVLLARNAIRNRPAYARIFSQLTGDYVPLEPLLPTIQVPVFILWGAQDRVLSVSAVQVMQPLLPQAQILILPETGHLPMVEQPRASGQAYRDFLLTTQD